VEALRDTCAPPNASDYDYFRHDEKKRRWVDVRIHRLSPSKTTALGGRDRLR
jgi:hypothetical protein